MQGEEGTANGGGDGADHTGAEPPPPSETVMIVGAVQAPPSLGDGEGDRVVYAESFDL